jgi:hypothetical protein
MPTLQGARLKIDWAKQHIARLEARIKLLEQSDVGSVQVDPEFGNEVIKHNVTDRDAVEQIALIAGDVVHNLKCALDYAWVEIVTKLAPSAVSKFAKFPIYPTCNALEVALRGNGIGQAPGNLFEGMLNQIQPYDGGDHAIWPIHRLNIRDKHRLLIPVIFYASISGIETEQQGVVSRDGFTPGTSQHPPWYVPMPLGVHVKNEGKASLSISFEYGKAGGEKVFADSFGYYSQHFLRIVERLETFIA